MTMRHLTLICMAGISTSLLVNKMKRLIRNENLEIAVTAMSERAFQGQTDVLLLGPQLGHRFESLKEQYESKGIRIDRIDPERFGAMDAKAVLEQAFPDLSGQIGDK
mgnify:FL=1